MTSQVDLGSVQGNVVRTYGTGFRWARYIFLEADELTMQSRQVVARWLAGVTFGDPKGGAGDSFINVSFTYRGLQALGLPRDVLEAFPDEFRHGASRRAGTLGDHWQDRVESLIPLHQAHLMLAIHSRSAGDLEHRWRELDTISARLGRPFQVVHCLDAMFSSNHREGFGFADGLSQPAIEGIDLDAVGDGVYATSPPRGPAPRGLGGRLLEDLGLRKPSRSWRLIRTGEFLLGYENEDGALPEGSYGPLGKNSTFMVYREIDQAPEAFNEYVKTSAEGSGLSEAELRAKIVGRWENGTPAIRRHPDPDDVASERRRANDYRYGHDPNGYGCPLGAHARRANPRDALPGGSEETMRHRIIRRGMPYKHVTDAHGSDRQGLAFVCFNASIRNGFEYVQRNWINSGAAFGLGSQRDFLLQDWGEQEMGTSMVIPGYRPAILQAPAKRFVNVRGCEYFYVPSRDACAWLAAFLARHE